MNAAVWTRAVTRQERRAYLASVTVLGHKLALEACIDTNNFQLSGLLTIVIHGISTFLGEARYQHMWSTSMAASTVLVAAQRGSAVSPGSM